MSKRILFVGDIHYRGENPRMRLDDYRQEMKDLIAQCFRLADHRGCDAIVFLGDLFDVSEPTGGVRNEFIDIMSKDPESDSLWNTPKYAIVGNHDLPGNNIKGLYRSALGTLEKIGVRIEETIPELSIFCGHYSHDIHQKNFEDREEEIIALHAYVLPNDLAIMGEDYYVSINNFKVSPNCKVVITGHYHDGYGIIERDDGVLFVCPGSLCRLKASKSDLERDIQVAFVEIDNKVTVSLEKLDYVDAHDIFDMSAIEKYRESRMIDKSELSNKLKEMRQLNSIVASDDPKKDFTDFASTVGLSSDALSSVMNILDEISIERKR